ncbi:MAG: hypothetical protein ACC618_03510 [Patescibacteria group bacterium]
MTSLSETVMDFIGFTLEVLGTVMIAYMALSVHYRVRKEHKIGERVIKHMRREQAVGVVGVVLIVAGYILQVPSKI